MDSDMTSEQIAEIERYKEFQQEIKKRESLEKKFIERYAFTKADTFDKSLLDADTFDRALVALEHMYCLMKNEYRKYLGERITEDYYQDLMQKKNDVFHAYFLLRELRKLFKVVEKSPESAVSES